MSAVGSNRWRANGSSETNGKTQVRFTHGGLVPRHECYENCSNAWPMLINGNLRNLIATGERQPDALAEKKEEEETKQVYD
jgi:hypothetical protein